MKEIQGYIMAHVPLIPPPFFCKLTLNDGTVVELKGNGTLRYNDIVQYKTLATEIEVGEKCTSIEGGFYSFTELVKLTIPSSVTSIQNQAPSITAGCLKLEEINFDAPLPLPSSIAGSYGVSNVNKIIIGPHVTGINPSACNTSHITSITIPSNVKYIGVGAFAGCKELTQVDILNGVTTIDYDAFRGCSGLTSVNIPNSVTSIAQNAFYDCSGLSSVTIGNSVSSIGENAFYGCSELSSVTFHCESIYSWFAYLPSIQEIVIGDEVTKINNNAFSACSGLTSVTIGNSVISIGEGAFWNCKNLTSITSLATTAPTIQFSTFSNVKTGGTLTVPAGSTGYDVWMGTGEYYLGSYGWTKVEQ